MSSSLENLDLIDLLSERHLQSRGIIEKMWNDSSDIHISNSEWFIMSRIYKKQPTISQVAKHIDISRQATHKFIKNLEAKGLIKVSDLENNKKGKCVQLTELGEECYRKNLALKENLEKKITAKIGTKNYQALKEILSSDWEL